MSLFTFVILAASVAVAHAEPPQVNTPSSAQACLPLQITWSGGTPPYYLGLIAAGQPSSPLLKDFGLQTGTSYVWNVDSPAGTSYTVQIRDNLGQLNYSDQFTIQPSGQTCSTSGGSNSSTTATTGSSSPVTGAAGSTAGKNSTASANPSTNSSSIAKSPSGAPITNSPTSASTSSNTSLHSTGSSTGNTTAANQARSSDATRLTSGFVGFAFSMALAVFA